MSSHVEIDLDHGRVIVGEATFPNGQWFEFYAALALARTNPNGADHFLSAVEIGRIGEWRHKKAGSIGKEIARHLGELDKASLRLIDHQGKTRAWRLNVAPDEISFVPDRQKAKEWLDARSTPADLPANWPSLLTALVEATTMVQAGESEQTLVRLEGVEAGEEEPSDVPIAAWIALVKGRAALNCDTSLLDEIRSDWDKRGDAAGKAVAARLKALWAYDKRFGDLGVGVDMLRGVAAQLERSGDLASLIPVLNILGLYERRAGNPDVSAGLHLRAAVLSGIVGDYQSLQGTIFNLALSRRASFKKKGLEPDSVCLDLVDLCLLVCRVFGVGRDSAQAETTAARWALRTGQLERAKGYLTQAEELLKHIDATFDQAAYKMTHALFPLRAQKEENLKAQIVDLKGAEKLFVEAGDVVSAKKAAEMRERLEVQLGPHGRQK